MGTRLPRCSSPSFAEKVKDAIPVEVREALLPLVQLVETVKDCIARYDQKIEELAITLKTAIGSESTVRVVCASLAGAAPELLLFFSACKAQLLDC